MKVSSDFKKNKTQKSFGFNYDNATERFILEFYDIDVFPLFLKAPNTKAYEIVLTKEGKLNMR